MTDSGSLLVASDALNIFRLTVSISLLFLISSIGIVANIINVIIHFRQGFQESVTLTLFTLSISDLGLSICCCLVALSTFANRMDAGFAIHPLSLTMAIFAPIIGLFYVISTFAATYLSVERCMCVVFPLKVKKIFTKKLTLAVMCIITVWGVACFIPYFCTQELRWTFDPQYNKTRLKRWTSEASVHAREVVMIVVQGIQPIVAQVIISICTWILIGKLKHLSSFRNETNQSNVIRMKKEAKLVKTVISIAVVFIICNFPQCISIIRFVVPSIAVVCQHENLYYIIFEILLCFISVNAAVNTIAYYKCSSMYRKMFQVIFNMQETTTAATIK